MLQFLKFEVWGKVALLIFISGTVCEEYVISVLSDLQHLSFHALALTYLDKVICDMITQATDSLPQQLMVQLHSTA